MKTNLYRVYLTVIFGASLWLGRGYADDNKQNNAIICWVLASASGAALQLTWTLKRR